ncbi:conjugal transfer protein [Streptomyces abikoensis]|uniref:conjugal transfer protein n=1 Tax=Streptomyces abikoensis TaxID=97398 RepID=UPI0033F739E0
MSPKEHRQKAKEAKRKGKAAQREKAKAEKARAAKTDRSQAGRPAARPGDRFDVPRPGGRLSGGRGTHVAARMTALVTGSLFALGIVGVMAYNAGHPAPLATGITDDQVSKYRLTAYPVERAIAFADRYARLCANQNPDQAEQRRQAIARLSSSGVDTTCGWDGKGTQTVAYSVWSGYMEPIPEFGEHGYYIGIQLQMTTGALRTLSVPVWAQDLKTGNGMRVVGGVGTLPQPDQASPPEVKDALQTDSDLSGDLQGKLFQDFFTAWGSSNGNNLTRYVAPDATKTARAGLRNALQTPKVTEVKVLLPKGVAASDGHKWKVGDTTWARVTVEWKSGDAHVTERYRVEVTLTDQGWFVKDIRAGIPDERGGAATVS